MREKLSLVEEELARALSADTEPRVLYKASTHLIRSGGKRLRPILTLIACEAVRGDFMKALPPASAIELIHTASLIHDDLIDGDLKRRGSSTVHVEYGRGVAMLSGDLLLSKAMRILSSSPSRIRRIISQACVEMCEGEYMDVVFKKHPEAVTEADYLEMVRKKTGALVKAAAECGGIVGGGSDRQILALAEYGESVGLSLQLRDDLREILAVKLRSTTLTSNCLLGEGSNLVLIHSFRNSNKSSQDFIRRLVTSSSNYRQVQEAIDFFKDSASIQHVQRLSEYFEAAAKKAVAGMNFSNQKIFEDLAELVSSY
ncbi:polyprenyl synthetase family protein [Candidatus Bathyarchaeota archaeon]|nr:polyprenyl synthetase family protein [Candidatus Bathyarchaeota archaeon]